MPWFLWLFFGLFYLVGFAVLGSGIWGAYWSTVAGGWPTAPGTVRRVELKEGGDSDGATWTVEVDYTYHVADKAYEGSTLAYGYCGSSERDAHAAVHQKLQAAKAIDVRYDPDLPATSCLSYGIHTSIKFLVLFGLTWLAFTLGMSMMFWIGSQGDAVLLENLATR